jgi:hypothetical protein
MEPQGNGSCHVLFFQRLIWPISFERIGRKVYLKVKAVTVSFVFLFLENELGIVEEQAEETTHEQPPRSNPRSEK